MKKSISLLLLSLLMITPSCQKPKEVTNEYNIVPQPNQLVPKEGRFELSNKVRLVVPSDAPEVKKVADGLCRTTETDCRNLSERSRKRGWKACYQFRTTRRYA